MYPRGVLITVIMLNGKTVLITGGTGSFGHHFVGYLLKHYKPKKIIIYSSILDVNQNMKNKGNVVYLIMMKMELCHLLENDGTEAH